MLRVIMVVGAIGLLACSEKQKQQQPQSQQQLPKAVDEDAGVKINQSGDPALMRKPEEVLKAFQKLEWGIGLSTPLYLLEYTPTTGHPLFCNNGRALLSEISKRILAEPVPRMCDPRMPPDADELELTCKIEVPGECPHVYRASLWTELDRYAGSTYRLLGTARLQERGCAEDNKKKVYEPDPDFKFYVQMGKSFQSVLEQCR